jgi:hypothetical protein
MTKLGRKAGVVVTGLVAVALAISGCGGSGGGEESKESSVKRPSAQPPVYHLAEYDMETGWVKETLDEKVGSYRQSVWHDPASFSSKLIIDSRPAAGALPPMAAAEFSRVRADDLPDYRERVLKRVKLGKRPAVRWAYFGAGEDRIDYFFEECGTSFVFRGSTSPIAYEPFSEFYGVVASRVKAVCNE